MILIVHTLPDFIGEFSMEDKFEIGRIIRAKSISDAWYRGLNIIWNHGTGDYR